MKFAWMVVAVTGVALAQDPFSADLKGFWGQVKNNVVRAAEKMPEEHYALKPVPEVRSFGQIIGHIADAQYMICAGALGEKREPAGVEKTKTSKADLVTALQASVKYCDGAYDALTDAKAAEMVKMFGRERTRLGALLANAAHSWEHYGNLVTYLRLKGIVPPSSEPRKK